MRLLVRPYLVLSTVSIAVAILVVTHLVLGVELPGGRH